MPANKVANFKDFQLLLLLALSYYFFFFSGTDRDLTSGHLEDPTTPPTILQLVLAQQSCCISSYIDTVEIRVIQKQSIKECFKGIAQLPCNSRLKKITLFTFKKRPNTHQLRKSIQNTKVANREQAIYIHPFL